MRKGIVSITLLLLSVFVYAQTSSAAKPSAPIDAKVTSGSVQIQGKQITYKAICGDFAFKDTEGTHKANMFYVAYIKQGESDISKRPITFVFNGGPGSASAWLHLGALGPKRIQMNADGNATEAPYKIINNEYSWLDYTDLVFIDPVGAGFSKAVQGEKSEQFFGFENDVKSVSDFIRLWTNQNNRWGSPKYIAGESYGTTRAVGVVDYLMSEYGMSFNGISLISCALDFQTLREFPQNDMPYIANLPVYALTAQYYNVIPQNANLKKQVEDFAIGEYALALLQGDRLSKEEKQAIAKKLSAFTGISEDVYVANNLRVPTWMFRKIVLEKQGKIAGRFDTRLSMLDPMLGRDYADLDPSFTEISAAFATAFNTYVRTDLQYTNDLPFYLIGNVSPWKFGDGKYLNVIPQLRDAMFQNPHMKVWLANGLYDLATSYFGTEYAINHLNIPSDLRTNIVSTYYKAGHMMYFLESEIKQLKQDASQFYTK